MPSSAEVGARQCNVLAIHGFGGFVTDAVGGSRRALNSAENLLTGWMNDPVRNPPSEGIYLRDDTINPTEAL